MVNLSLGEYGKSGIYIMEVLGNMGCLVDIGTWEVYENVGCLREHGKSWGKWEVWGNMGNLG